MIFPWIFDVISGYHVVVGPQVDATLVVAMAFAIDVASLIFFFGGCWGKCGTKMVGNPRKIMGKSWENLDKIMEMLENDVKFLKTFLEFDKYWKMMIHDDHMFFSMRSPLLRTSPLFCSKTNLSWLS
jgi:hypothetical protein